MDYGFWLTVVMLGGGLVVVALLGALVVGALNPVYRGMMPSEQVRLWIGQKLDRWRGRQ